MHLITELLAISKVVNIFVWRWVKSKREIMQHDVLAVKAKLLAKEPELFCNEREGGREGGRVPICTW